MCRIENKAWLSSTQTWYIARKLYMGKALLIFGISELKLNLIFKL